MYAEADRSDTLAERVKSLPESPGVYQFMDAGQRIIYVGKAKNLRKRVSSYFTRKPDHAKLAVLVKKIQSIQHTVVDTESDALLLENNLIKKHQPRYNVLLKDDKTFPWICIKNEPFPRVFTTRNYIHDGSHYFGPYTSGRIWKTMLDLIRGIYKIRTCTLNLAPDRIAENKYKVCLEYHLGNCLGPCVGEHSEADYAQQITEIEKILNGHTSEVIRVLKNRMKELADHYRFEEAARVKERLEMLERFQAKSTIVHTGIRDLDVFAIVSDDQSGYVNYLKVVNGAVIQALSLELKKRLNEDSSELLRLAVFEIRQRTRSKTRHIIASEPFDFEDDEFSVSIPLRGDKKTLIDLSLRNARAFRLDRQKQKIKHLPATRVSRRLETLQKDLRMSSLPVHIECFDNSNIQGSEPVAACVVFRHARPSKADYRHYNIKTVEGPDDFASMEEVIFRRYSRLISEEKELPQLIVIDGGKGQLHAAVKSLDKLGLRRQIAIIGIAKRLEEIYFPNDPVPLYLDKNSESLKIIQNLRNEAHRFGITHHRSRRSKAFLHSELNRIKGIGEKTRESLLTRFGSVNRISTATFDELSAVTGPAKARLIHTHFNPAENETD